MLCVVTISIYDFDTLQSYIKHFIGWCMFMKIQAVSLPLLLNTIPSSYSKYKGIKTTIRVNGSLVGVIIAASTNNITMACLRYFLKNSLVTRPNLESIHANSGSSKTTPITKTSTIKIPI